jgi:hypothetical protein
MLHIIFRLGKFNFRLYRSTSAWVCGRSLAGIVGSNPTGDMNVCLL